MSRYISVEYSRNCRKTRGKLWNYYRGESNSHPTNNYNADPKTNFASFKYKSSITRKTLNSDEDQDEKDNRKK